MGGSSGIERDVISVNYNSTTNSKTTTKHNYSKQSEEVFKNNKTLHKSCDPKIQFDEDEKLVSKFKSPIVLCLDVTGSMTDWPKVIYDKLPMFYGQIVEQGYLKDPSISFCAIDDFNSGCPIQVTNFGQGKQIDELISKIWLVGRGGGPTNKHHPCEAYDLGFYFYSKKSDVSNSDLPFYFIIADEGFRYQSKVENIKKYIGDDIDKDISTSELIQELKKQYNVFLLQKDHGSKTNILEKLWKDELGEENVLQVSNPKACVDVMLGVMAIASKERTLKERKN
eukprot:gene7119-11282_t